MSDNLSKIKLQKFICNYCDFKCYNKNDYNRHNLTMKHKRLTETYKIIDTNTDIITKKTPRKYICNCGKDYLHRQSLFNHKKNCESLLNIQKNDNEQTAEIKMDDNKKLTDIIFEVMKQNQEFQKLILEQNKQIIELSNKNNITTNYSNITNSNNKTFNLNMFLNEKCKDALNINEFVDSLKISFADLENIGENGFVNGISKIFVNGLKSLDVYKRPIHCSDLKRETMYLKEDNIWEKDNENKDRLKKAVKMIAHKNMLKIGDWKQSNPQYKNSDSKKNDLYLKMLIGTAGPTNKEDEIAHYEKIIKNIAKEVTIDKEI